MKNLKECNFCKGKEFRELFLARDKKIQSKEIFRVVKCKKCGLIFLNPQPSFKELEEHYPKEYYSLGRIQDTNSMKTRLKLFLYKVYSDPMRKNWARKIIFSPFLPYLRGAPIIKGAKLLDVGCGSGQFIYEMKKFGLEVYGVEPGDFDEKSAEEFGLNIKKKDLLSAKYPRESFDIVTMSHVLEHTSDPSENLKEVYKVLRKGGLFIVRVPNYNSLSFSLFGKNWYGLDIPRHLYNFSDKILIKRLESEGFRIKRIAYDSRPYQFSSSIKQMLHLSNISFKIMNLLFLPLTYAVNLLKKGDQIEIYCKK